MKILIIDNASIIKKNGLFCTNNLNGLFLEDLIKEENDVFYFQFVIESENSISVFDLLGHRIKCIPIPIIKNKILRYIYAYLRLIREIVKVDFVYFYYPNTFKFATFLCRILKRDYGLYIRGMQGVTSVASKMIYKGAKTIFTVSDYFTQFVNKSVGKNIANTIRPMIPYTNDDVVVNRVYEKKPHYEILFLGRIDSDKGIVELLNAIKCLKDKNKYNFILKMVGNGPFISESKKIACELDINDVVSFEGAVYDDEKKRQYYLNTDVYILPTYHEGFPRTLYEAMIFGTPIITTMVGGIPSLMKDKVNCLEIRPKSIDSIVDVLEYVFENYGKVGDCAQNATNIVGKIVDKNRLTHGQHLNKIIKGL